MPAKVEGLSASRHGEQRSAIGGPEAVGIPRKMEQRRRALPTRRTDDEGQPRGYRLRPVVLEARMNRPGDLSLHHDRPVHQDQFERPPACGCPDPDALVRPRLHHRGGLLPAFVRSASDREGEPVTARPHGHGRPDPHTRPSERVHPCHGRPPGESEERVIPRREHGVHSQRGQECRVIGVQLPHDRRRPRHGVGRGQPACREHGAGDLGGAARQQFQVGQVADQGRQRPCHGSGLVHTQPAKRPPQPAQHQPASSRHRRLRATSFW